jgi:cysteine-rich repeat protein
VAGQAAGVETVRGGCELAHRRHGARPRGRVRPRTVICENAAGADHRVAARGEYPRRSMRVVRRGPTIAALVFAACLGASARAGAAECGDGVLAAGEGCDDGNAAAGDGCGPACAVEVGWSCAAASLRPEFVEELTASDHASPDWRVSSDARTLSQPLSANASIAGTGLELNGVSLTFTMQITSGRDDDFVGWVIGYDRGDARDPRGEWLLFDWKRADVHTGRCRGHLGLAMSRVSGALVQGDGDRDAPRDDPADDDALWCHQGPIVEVVRANTLGERGWTAGSQHQIRVDYATTRVDVWVDGQLQFTEVGAFPRGKLGFYSFSQAGVRFTLPPSPRASICAWLDSDADDVPDPRELRLGMDPRRADSDEDGVPDGVEVGDGDTPRDHDGDGVPDFKDEDDDGDGILTRDESPDGDTTPANDDRDRDGLPDYLDDDDDGDGAPTAFERSGGRRGLAPADGDRDGVPDYLDVDDDGDGVWTIHEVHDGDGDPRDDDGDGDGVPDYLDVDDDGDGVPTSAEVYVGDARPGETDSDRDGAPDYRDVDDDGDGVPTWIEVLALDRRPAREDDDGDHVPDYLDPDDDNDGIPDADDGDDDRDGVPDQYDEDDDDDGVPDERDDDDDRDGDTIPDYLDRDSAELLALYVTLRPASPNDADGDGRGDYIDPDSDNDGVRDADEAARGFHAYAADSDLDGVPDGRARGPAADPAPGAADGPRMSEQVDEVSVADEPAPAAAAAVEPAGAEAAGLSEALTTAVTGTARGCGCDSGDTTGSVPGAALVLLTCLAYRRSRAAG